MSKNFKSLSPNLSVSYPSVLIFFFHRHRERVIYTCCFPLLVTHSPFILLHSGLLCPTGSQRQSTASLLGKQGRLHCTVVSAAVTLLCSGTTFPTSCQTVLPPTQCVQPSLVISSHSSLLKPCSLSAPVVHPPLT